MSGPDSTGSTISGPIGRSIWKVRLKITPRSVRVDWKPAASEKWRGYDRAQRIDRNCDALVEAADSLHQIAEYLQGYGALDTMQIRELAGVALVEGNRRIAERAELAS